MIVKSSSSWRNLLRKLSIRVPVNDRFFESL